MEEAIQLAGLLGPILMVLAFSEALNLSIWTKVPSSVVYLNGLLLFIGGLSIIRAYPHWAMDWTILVTLTGWSSLILGLYRVFFPVAPQLKKSKTTYVVLLLLLVVGLLLSYKGYVN